MCKYFLDEAPAFLRDCLKLIDERQNSICLNYSIGRLQRLRFLQESLFSCRKPMVTYTS